MEYKWNDDWRTELEEKHHKCYDRLCECRNTANDVAIMARLMSKYNPTRAKDDCLDRMVEWVSGGNGQFWVMDEILNDYDKYLKKV